MSELKEEIERIDYLKSELDDLKELNELGEDIVKKINDFKEKIGKEELKIFFSGKYDKNNALLEIHAGAGGVDAQDWATMLLRMYERYCDSKGFETKVISQSFGEGGGPEGRIGTKSVILEVKGSYAYGLLKKETGVHRMVRQSPFSSKNLRHTSFALVELLPQITQKEQSEIEIRPDDIKVDVYRASGPGGQYVNKRESAVRITHLPTGIVSTSQSERLQGLNKKKAMDVLYAKLSKLSEDERKKELKEIKGDLISAGWGSQIRSYVLHPYKLVKDLRTGVETSNADKVLNGGLDEFIEAEIKNVKI
jgi:peptide chain release factor 2